MRVDCMRSAALAAIAVLSTAAARAQMSQYTSPGSLADQEIPTQERLKTAMDEARFHLGSVSVAPWFALKDVGYYSNVFGTTSGEKSDFTATAGAGLVAYVPVGHRLTLGMYALPEYVWWKDLANRRGWNGAGGAGLFGYFNRMTLEVQGGAARHQQYPSSEVEQLVNLGDDNVAALLEVQLGSRLSVFGRVRADRWRYDRRGLDPVLADQLSLLDRDDTNLRGGLRYHFGEKTSIGFGVGRFTSDFVHQEDARSSSGNAPFVEVSVRSGHFRVSGDATWLDLKPSSGSAFVPYRGTNGNVRVAFAPTERMDLLVYGGRNLTYSIQAGQSYYLNELSGVAVQSQLGWRSAIRLYRETGSSPYVAAEGGTSAGTDHYTGTGFSLTVRAARTMYLVVGGSRLEYTSPDRRRDRAVNQIQANIQLQSAEAQWW